MQPSWPLTLTSPRNDVGSPAQSSPSNGLSQHLQQRKSLLSTTESITTSWHTPLNQLLIDSLMAVGCMSVSSSPLVAMPVSHLPRKPSHHALNGKSLLLCLPLNAAIGPALTPAEGAFDGRWPCGGQPPSWAALAVSQGCSGPHLCPHLCMRSACSWRQRRWRPSPAAWTRPLGPSLAGVHASLRLECNDCIIPWT